MNGSDQRAAGTRYAQLSAQIEQLLEVSVAIDARVLLLAKEARWSHEELGTMRLEASELRERSERNRCNLNVAFEHENETRRSLYCFQHLPFLSRLRWLFLGVA